MWATSPVEAAIYAYIIHTCLQGCCFSDLSTCLNAAFNNNLALKWAINVNKNVKKKLPSLYDKMRHGNCGNCGNPTNLKPPPPHQKKKKTALTRIIVKPN